MLQKAIERVWRPIQQNWRAAPLIAAAGAESLRELWHRLRIWWRRKRRRSWVVREFVLSTKWAAVITISMMLRRWFEQWVGGGWLVESILDGNFNPILDVLEKGEAT